MKVCASYPKIYLPEPVIPLYYISRRVLQRPLTLPYGTVQVGCFGSHIHHVLSCTLSRAFTRTGLISRRFGAYGFLSIFLELRHQQTQPPSTLHPVRYRPLLHPIYLSPTKSYHPLWNPLFRTFQLYASHHA